MSKRTNEAGSCLVSGSGWSRGRGRPKLGGDGGRCRGKKSVPGIGPHHQGHWSRCILLFEELLGL